MTLTVYAKHLKETSMYAKANEDYDVADPDLLGFEKGDLIVIKEKYDDGWYYGECNGRRGQFPADKVTLLLRPLDSQEIIEQNTKTMRRGSLPPTPTGVRGGLPPTPTSTPAVTQFDQLQSLGLETWARLKFRDPTQATLKRKKGRRATIASEVDVTYSPQV